MAPKSRLDEMLCLRGLARDRREARGLILSGRVFVEGRRIDKAGSPVAADAEIRLAASDPYVSRGGVKLEGALRCFRLDVEGKACVDLGSSTGGFTDCLLQRGASRVYAFDVGRGLLDWRLRNDPRVRVREGFHVRELRPSDVTDPVDLITADLSFISLVQILPALKRFPDAQFLLLVKPQFEAPREEVEPGGVVRGGARQWRVVSGFVRRAEADGFRLLGIAPSFLKGQKGNQEYFVLLEARKR
jgi:23S rRNA (cytidine1920-2'-O)/16S rRNA (cytidine1409-2'-O)-methyltransferase